MKKQSTLKDVASVAKVSTATVARVLHGRGYVSEGARQRVFDAIQSTDYRLNMLAQSLKRNRTMTIGHLLTSISPNPYYAGVELGVEQEAIAHEYNVLLWNSFDNTEREQLGVEMFIKRQVDAMVFTTPTDPKNVRIATDAGIPVVQVERPTSVQTHMVLVDHYAGSVSATEYLIEMGHRNIAFLGGNPNLYAGHTNTRIEEERLAGYVDTLKSHDIPVREDQILLGRYYSLEDGYQFMKALLACQERATAVFATCDILAAGALQAIYEEGLRIPADISVVGFDNTYAPYLAPPLTTVELPMLEIGKTAARIVIDVLGEEEPSACPPRVEHLSTHLAIRSSTGK